MSIRDVRRAQRQLQQAITAFAEVVYAETTAARTVHRATRLAVLFDALDKPRVGFTQQLALVRDTVALALHETIIDDPNRQRIFPGIGVLACAWQGSDQWDGVAIAKRVVARGVDMYPVDKETGEIRPPAVFAEMLLNDLIACAGLDRKSQPWKKEELRGRGIPPEPHVRRDPHARKTIRRK